MEYSKPPAARFGPRAPVFAGRIDQPAGLFEESTHSEGSRSPQMPRRGSTELVAGVRATTVWRVRDSKTAGTSSQLLDSNQRPTVYETVALPTELSWLGRRGSRPIPPVLTSTTWPSNTTLGRGSCRSGGRFENLEPGGGRPWKGRSATGRVSGCFDGRPSETCSWPVRPGCSWWPFG